MQALRKCKEFIRMLEHNQNILQAEIIKSEGILAHIKLLMSEQQHQFDMINKEIKNLSPKGLLSRKEMFKNIRSQAVLLSKQQFLIYRINEIEQELDQQNNKVKEKKNTMFKLNKRHRKLSSHSIRIRRRYFLDNLNKSENEIQEVACYGRKDL